jgi:hypothetical protein
LILSVVRWVVVAAVIVAVVVIAARITPAPLVASPEVTGNMVPDAYPAGAVVGREGAAADMSAHATDMRSSKSPADMTTPEAAAYMATTTPEAAAHVAATATAPMASAAATVATATTAPTSQGVGCYGNSSQRDSRDQDDCSMQLDSFHDDIPFGW